jgi:hypothetical protein
MDGPRLPPQGTPSNGPYARIAGESRLKPDEIMRAELLPSGDMEWGSVTLSRPAYNKIRALADPSNLSRDPEVRREQLAALVEIKAGKVPYGGPVQPAPEGTTVDSLLDRGNQKEPLPNGRYEFGNLRVPAKEYEAFVAAQREICKNPEGLAMLHHMVNYKTEKPLVVQLREPEMVHFGAAYTAEENTIRWSPIAAVRDKTGSQAMVPPATGLLHEEAHWAAGEVGKYLQKIPDEKYDNLEERRVISGVEARDLDLRHLPHRESHKGFVVPVRDVNEIHPVIHTNPGPNAQPHGPGFVQSGKIVGVNQDTVTLQTLANDPRHTMTFKTMDLVFATGESVVTTTNILENAQKNNDPVTIRVTPKGVFYDSPEQFARLQDPAKSPPGANVVGARLEAAVQQARIPHHEQAHALSH